MCGIVGVCGEGVESSVLDRLTDALRHRGPDSRGTWSGDGVAFGHRRLSILDLSTTGHQPMASASERFVVTFNGEIYNYQDLRQELGPLPWRGSSDTEVLLAAFERWGVPETLPRLNGMFAFALWDRHERRLHLARDRYGEKPLYYGWQRRSFLFASELKALRAHPDFHAPLDPAALALFLRHAYVPAPRSIYQGIFKLPPGTHLVVDPSRTGEHPEPRSYASPVFPDPAPDSRVPVADDLDVLLRDAVRLRMQADVPLGAFLSGGFDSSTIVALMQAQSSRPVRTFTIGSRESGYDEAADARAVAAHLKTDHTELYVTPKEAQDVVPLLPALYDEPFGDSSQIPTYLVSKLARQHVTVALSGDGGDELFGGYQRYFLGRQIWNTVGWIPRPLRGAAAWGLRAIPRGFWSLMSPGRPRLGEQVHKLGTVLAADDPDAFYLDLVSLWRLDERLVIGAPESILEDAVRTPSADFARRMMQRDLQSYLPDDILVKVDRASMGVGLEARVPFLDPRVVEFAARLPMDALIRGGEGKRILREVLYRYVPRELVDRPKMGFGIPLAEWLQGPLREWAEDLLSEASLRTAGILRPEPIRAQWRMHVAGRGNAAYRIWNVLVFEQWRRSLAGT